VGNPKREIRNPKGIQQSLSFSDFRFRISCFGFRISCFGFLQNEGGMATAAVLRTPEMTLPAGWYARLPNLTSVAAIVLLAANYFGPFADLDFTWQIRTGERIVQLGQLRTPEAFSYTIAGADVPDFEWLYEVVLWLVWSGWGFGGLKLLKTVLVVTPLVLVGLRLRAEKVPGHVIFLALLTAVAVLNPVWNLRPLYCTTIGLLLVSWLLHDHCTGRRPLPWWLPLVTLLWANLHPGVITGQGILAGAIAWEWLNRRLKLNAPLSKAACRRLTVISGLALAATLLSPDPLDRLLYPFRPELAHPVQRIFAEMQPLHWFILTPPYLSNLAYGVALLVGLTAVFRFRQYRLWELAMLAGLAGLANLAFRSLQDWLLVMLAVGVPHLVALFRQAVTTGRRRWWVKKLLKADRACKRALSGPLFRFQWVWPAAALGVLAVLSLVPPLARAMPVQDAAEWPAAALDHIDRAGLAGNFFAPADYGSYLTWRRGDRARSYVDTRGFFFPPALIEDSHYLPLLTPDWRSRLDRVLNQYRTDYFLLEASGPRGELWRLLGPHVGQPLYQDDQAVLLSAGQVRRGVASLDGVRAASR
jgi:hypothetical protein